MKLYPLNDVNCFFFFLVILVFVFSKRPPHSKGKGRFKNLPFLFNVPRNDTPMRRQNQARRRPTSPASSSCRCRWVAVIFLSVTEALMQHLKTLFFTSSCPLWLRRTAIVSQNAGFEIGLHARPSSDPSSLNHPNYKAATLQDSWPYSCVKTKIQKKEGGKKNFRRASKLFQAPWWLWGKKFSTDGAGGLCSSAEDHIRSRTTLFAFSFFISASL